MLPILRGVRKELFKAGRGQRVSNDLRKQNTRMGHSFADRRVSVAVDLSPHPNIATPGQKLYVERMKRTLLITTAIFALMAAPLGAHPHIFVDTGLELITDAKGRLTHVRVTWQYDDFYSLLITEDMGLDQDGDGALTESEHTRLTGFDMQWVDGFDGDLEVMVAGTPVGLSQPQKVTAQFDQGRITTTHLRSFDTPVQADKTVILKAYDPTYYTAYEMTRPVVATGGAECQIRLQGPAMTPDLAQMQQDLAGLDAQSDPADAGLPEIGAQMASTVSVTCAGS